MNPLIESRIKKLTIHCPVCKRPMGQRLGNQWWFSLGGGQQFAKTSVIMGQNTPTGHYTVKCPDKNCSGAHHFVWINEKISLQSADVIDNQKTES